MEISIYLTNLGKYNEGELVGKWVKLPISDTGKALKEIGVENGTEYEEFFITDYESPFKIDPYESLDYLNQVAENLKDMPDGVEGLQQMLDEMGYKNFEELDYRENDEDTVADLLKGRDAWGIACAVNHGSWNAGHDLVKLDGYGNLVSKDQFLVDKEIEYRKADIVKEYLETL